MNIVVVVRESGFGAERISWSTIVFLEERKAALVGDVQILWLKIVEKDPSFVPHGHSFCLCFGQSELTFRKARFFRQNACAELT